MSPPIQQQYYLIGSPVSHSLSPVIHNTAFAVLGLDLHYVTQDVSDEALGDIVERIDGVQVLGANVTIPHKEAIIPFLDGLDESAMKVQAVNTVVIRDGKRIGFNTDVTGFLEPLAHRSFSRVLILGAGGAARAVLVAANDFLKAEHISVVSRRLEQARAACTDLQMGAAIPWSDMPHEARQADLIVNTTPIGMWPHTQASPLQRSSLRSHQVVYDIVYNPAQTQLMTEAKLAGAHAIGGLSMLVGQAAEAFTLWTGQQMPLLDVKKALQQHLETRSVS
ncbi:MAG: shikimate dehydrogenase [Rhodothermales bacterium]|nr:shikimate dehydrogenase [Rhodothermales bacterium]